MPLVISTRKINEMWFFKPVHRRLCWQLDVWLRKFWTSRQSLSSFRGCWRLQGLPLSSHWVNYF